MRTKAVFEYLKAGLKIRTEKIWRNFKTDNWKGCVRNFVHICFRLIIGTLCCGREPKASFPTDQQLRRSRSGILWRTPSLLYTHFVQLPSVQVLSGSPITSGELCTFWETVSFLMTRKRPARQWNADKQGGWWRRIQGSFWRACPAVCRENC